MSLMSLPEHPHHLSLSWPTLHSLSASSWTHTIKFSPVYHHHSFAKKNLPNVRSQRNVKTWTQRRGRKSMLACQKSTCPFQKALCWILHFERSHGSCSDMNSDLIAPVLKQHKINHVERSATALLLQGSGTCWDHSKEPQPAELSAFHTEKLSLKSLHKARLNMKG